VTSKERPGGGEEDASVEDTLSASDQIETVVEGWGITQLLCIHPRAWKQFSASRCRPSLKVFSKLRKWNLLK